MNKLEVKIPSDSGCSYDIHIGTGTLSGLRSQLEEDFAGRQMFIVTDANLVYAGHLRTFMAASHIPSYVIDPPGEISKHIDTVKAIIEAMEEAFLGRDSIIIALGGGTVGDIAGFAAAIFKRGIPVIQIPTTTVAQADSSVGGKTGVDSTRSKNAYGAFWQPKAVHIDTATLATLDDRQYKAGLVESVKHALIADSEYFAFFEKNMGSILSRDASILEKIAHANCSIKAAVVAEDPTEKNKRRILNYGHTIGHAVESVSLFQLLHGEAIAIGIIGAGIIEQQLGLSDKESCGRIECVLKELSMPVRIPPDMDKNDLIDAIKRDKKAVDKWPRLVLLEKIGTALCRDGQWAHEVPREIVEKTIDRLY